jgi:hypothetical protein
MDDTQRAIVASVAIGVPASGAITWIATISEHPSNGPLLRILPPVALFAWSFLMLWIALDDPRRGRLKKAIHNGKEALRELDDGMLNTWRANTWEPAVRPTVDDYGVAATRRFLHARDGALMAGAGGRGMLDAQIKVLHDLKKRRFRKRRS